MTAALALHHNIGAGIPRPWTPSVNGYSALSTHSRLSSGVCTRNSAILTPLTSFFVVATSDRFWRP
ncbi:hypothetical protein PILCRDRAFT_816938 [Piloderma croceum F 1598]|uniref:Uncharacterized protein n=1 Tax=Piloderma croceum (strain F 1598) TaxID=765440 RepID=A0A0C3G1M4_PILCF|nr:hypothetical protein PILCRDRAFT_816938 [Piloderma croceum F 1598]